ncbi:MAG: flagellar filament capping protein FliD [Betaproteobacteria bacterium]
MATSNVNFVNALGAGSGIDTKALGQSLVEAERAPRKNQIDGKIKKEEAKITGHGAIKSLLADLQKSLAKINDAKEFSSITPNNSQPSAFGVTSDATAEAGNYSVEVGRIAKATRLATANFSDSSIPLNGNSPFDLWINKVGGPVDGQQTVTFANLTAGQSVTVGGLVLTASANMTAAEVATALSTPANTSGNSYALSGSLSGWSVDAASGANLSLTSSPASTTAVSVSTAGDGGAVPAPDLPTLGYTQKITVNLATPAGIFKEINAATKNTGVSAQMVKTGSGSTITFTGQTGAANAFTLSNLPSGLTLRASALDTAQDAQLSVNGLPITSGTNSVSDVIAGVTFDLYAPTTSGTPARLDLNRQTTAIKDNIKAVVEAYNLFDDSLKVLADKDSKVEGFGGALAGDSIINTVRNQIRAMFTKSGKVYPKNDETQPPLNPDVHAARHIGLSFDRTGKLTLDEGKLDTALSDHFDQVVTLLTANKNDQSIYDIKTPGGLAGDAVKNIEKMLRSTGSLDAQSKSATARIEQYKKELTQLEERMTALQERYTKQFSVMESVVGDSNSTKSSLTSSFKGLMAMYTNN